MINKTVAQVIEVMREANVPSDRITPTAEGDIALYFFPRNREVARFAMVECCNDGGITLLLCDRTEGRMKAWSGSGEERIQSMLVEMRDFLDMGF